MGLIETLLPEAWQTFTLHDFYNPRPCAPCVRTPCNFDSSQTFPMHPIFYPCIGAIAYSGSRYGPGTGPVYLDDVGCTGSENMLTNCSRNYFGVVGSNCRSHFEDASILCPTSKHLHVDVERNIG